MKKKSFFIFYILVAFIVALTGNTRDYWPTTTWKESTPEEQGIDSEKLIEFITTVQKEKRHLHSLLIIRNGRLVTEAYFNPYNKNIKHIIFSATKSVSSLLIGLAIKDGFIKDVNQKILDFFPEYQGKIQCLDDKKKSLCLYDLLTMTEELQWKDWPYRVGMEGDFLKLLSASDGVKYYLDKPMKKTGDSSFNYNSGNSYMLSAIIQKCTGKSALDYAREKLFKPIGILDSCWGIFQNGIYNGGSEMFLKPRDMARIGFLVLNKGNWDGKQIIPSQWIESSTKPYVKTSFLNYKYGYMWYIDTSLPFRNISAQGLGGQYISIIPELDMVVIFTGGMVVNRDEEEIQYYYLRDYILAAVKSSDPLPKNPEANNRLNRIIKECLYPKTSPVSAVPPVAKEISAKSFFFDHSDAKINPLSIKSAALIFAAKNQCKIRFTFPENPQYISIGFDGVYRTNPYSNRLKVLEVEVGMDNVYRTTWIKTEIGPMPFFAKGTWTDEHTFNINCKTGWSLPERIVFTFENPQSLSLVWSSIFYKCSPILSDKSLLSKK